MRRIERMKAGSITLAKADPAEIELEEDLICQKNKLPHLCGRHCFTMSDFSEHAQEPHGFSSHGL